ncbi:MAG: hypothetical protein II458_06650 [Oscillospiraceae bacterium]|nr:hypothetical protein [Oscillospiraceae bacterium]
MKKNRVMRVFSLLLALTLISTCAISGTFAKYVTKAEGEDQARVAKWGILLTMEGDKMFAPEYEADDTTFESQDGTKMSVRVDPNYDGDIKDLVAPGTTNDGFKASIVGQPEVAVRYTLHIDSDWTDVVLPKGEYTDFTKLTPNDNGELGYNGKFTLDKDYAPVKWDITVSKNGGNPISLTQVAATKPELAAAMGGTADGFSATDAKVIVKKYATQLAALMLSIINDNGEAGASNAVFTVNDDNSIDLSVDFDANRSLNFEFGLKWTWAYEQEDDVELYDAADTWLGNYAAYKAFGECADYADEFDAAGASYEIGFKFVATAVQID